MTSNTNQFFPSETNRDNQFNSAFFEGYVNRTGRLKKHFRSQSNLTISNLFLSRVKDLLRTSVCYRGIRTDLLHIFLAQRATISSKTQSPVEIIKIEISGSTARKAIPAEDITAYFKQLGITALVANRCLGPMTDIDSRTHLKSNQDVESVAIQTLRYLVSQRNIPVYVNDTLNQLLVKLRLPRLGSWGEFELITLPNEEKFPTNFDITIGQAYKTYCLFADTNFFIIIDPNSLSEDLSHLSVEVHSVGTNSAEALVWKELGLIGPISPENYNYTVCFNYLWRTIQGETCQVPTAYPIYAKTFLDHFYNPYKFLKNVPKLLNRIASHHSPYPEMAAAWMWLQFELWLPLVSFPKESQYLPDQVWIKLIQSNLSEFNKLAATYPCLQLKIKHQLPSELIGAVLFCSAALRLALPNVNSSIHGYKVALTREHNKPALEYRFPFEHISEGEEEKSYSLFLDFSLDRWSQAIEKYYRLEVSPLLLNLLMENLTTLMSDTPTPSSLERYQQFLEKDEEVVLARVKKFLASSDPFLIGTGAAFLAILTAMGSAHAKSVLAQVLPQCFSHRCDQIVSLAHAIASHLLPFLAPAEYRKDILKHLDTCKNRDLKGWILALGYIQNPHLTRLAKKYLSSMFLADFKKCLTTGYPETLAQVALRPCAQAYWKEQGLLEEITNTLFISLAEELADAKLKALVLEKIDPSLLSVKNQARRQIVVDGLELSDNAQKQFLISQGPTSLNPRVIFQLIQLYLKEERYGLIYPLLVKLQHLECSQLQRQELSRLIHQAAIPLIQSQPPIEEITSLLCETGLKQLSASDLDHYFKTYAPQDSLFSYQSRLIKQALKNPSSIPFSTKSFILQTLDLMLAKQPIPLHLCYDLFQSVLNSSEIMKVHGLHIGRHLITWASHALDHWSYSCLSISTLLTHPNVKGYLPSYTNRLDFFIKFCQRMANENSKQALTQTIALLELLPFVYTNADEEQAFHQLVRSLKKQAARDNETLCFVSSIKHIAIQATLLKIQFHLDKTQKTDASLHQLFHQLLSSMSQLNLSQRKTLQKMALKLLKNTENVLEIIPSWLMLESCAESLGFATWSKCCLWWLGQAKNADKQNSLCYQQMFDRILAVCSNASLQKDIESLSHLTNYLLNQGWPKSISDAVYWNALQIITSSLNKESTLQWEEQSLKLAQKCISKKAYELAADVIQHPLIIRSISHRQLYQELQTLLFQECLNESTLKKLVIAFQVSKKCPELRTQIFWQKLWLLLSQLKNNKLLDEFFKTYLRDLSLQIASGLSSEQQEQLALMLPALYLHQSTHLQKFLDSPEVISKALETYPSLKKVACPFVQHLFELIKQKRPILSLTVLKQFYSLYEVYSLNNENKLAIHLFVLENYAAQQEADNSFYYNSLKQLNCTLLSKEYDRSLIVNFFERIKKWNCDSEDPEKLHWNILLYSLKELPLSSSTELKMIKWIVEAKNGLQSFIKIELLTKFLNNFFKKNPQTSKNIKELNLLNSLLSLINYSPSTTQKEYDILFNYLKTLESIDRSSSVLIPRNNLVNYILDLHLKNFDYHEINDYFKNVDCCYVIELFQKHYSFLVKDDHQEVFNNLNSIFIRYILYHPLQSKVISIGQKITDIIYLQSPKLQVEYHFNLLYNLFQSKLKLKLSKNNNNFYISVLVQAVIRILELKPFNLSSSSLEKFKEILPNILITIQTTPGSNIFINDLIKIFALIKKYLFNNDAKQLQPYLEHEKTLKVYYMHDLSIQEQKNRLFDFLNFLKDKHPTYYENSLHLVIACQKTEDYYPRNLQEELEILQKIVLDIKTLTPPVSLNRFFNYFSYYLEYNNSNNNLNNKSKKEIQDFHDLFVEVYTLMYKDNIYLSQFNEIYSDIFSIILFFSSCFKNRESLLPNTYKKMYELFYPACRIFCEHTTNLESKNAEALKELLIALKSSLKVFESLFRQDSNQATILLEAVMTAYISCFSLVYQKFSSVDWLLEEINHVIHYEGNLALLRLVLPNEQAQLWVAKCLISKYETSENAFTKVCMEFIAYLRDCQKGLTAQSSILQSYKDLFGNILDQGLDEDCVKDIQQIEQAIQICRAYFVNIGHKEAIQTLDEFPDVIPSSESILNSGSSINVRNYYVSLDDFGTEIDIEFEFN